MTRLKAIAEGKMLDGLIECYVLENGRRVISQRGIVKALTTQNAAENDGRKAGDFEQYLAKLPENHRPKSTDASLEFERPGGGIASGREGSFFVDLCQSYVAAFVAGELHHKQVKLAMRAMVVLSALAKVGIEALIDEATGYQQHREHNALERRMKEVLRFEAGKWELCFSTNLVRALAPLWGFVYTNGKHPTGLQNAYGRIYDTLLGKEMASEMRRRNANPGNNNHHQLLQDAAKSALRDNLAVIELLAKQSGTRDEFWARVDAHYKSEPLQLGLTRVA